MTSREVQDDLDEAQWAMDDVKEKQDLTYADHIAVAQVYALMGLARAVDRLAEQRR